MTPDELLLERCRELRARSAAAVKRSQELTSRVEDAHKRAEAMRMASKIACDNADHILKKCGCGKTYLMDEWFDLPFAGYQDNQFIGGEMRHCGCSSTLLFVTRKGESR